jgi:hypothetical protein
VYGAPLRQHRKDIFILLSSGSVNPCRAIFCERPHGHGSAGCRTETPYARSKGRHESLSACVVEMRLRMERLRRNRTNSRSRSTRLIAARDP